MARINILLIIFTLGLVVSAQVRPRDYTISPPRVSYDAESGAATVSFDIRNQGGDASEASQIVISENISGEIWHTEALPILGADAEQSFSIPMRLADLPEDEVFFVVEAGIDDYELAGSPIALNNTQIFRISLAEAGGSGAGAAGSSAAAPRYDLFLPLVNLGVNFLSDGIQINDSRFSRTDLLGFGLALIITLFCLWLLSLVLRLAFRRSPKFEPWQPPYAANTWTDPNSALGRRQAWQFHAQNSTIGAPNAPNQVSVIKRLTDGDGASLGGWTFTAIRTVQYDIYGRISRTEVVMPRKINKALNRVAKRAPRLDQSELRKAVQPIAKRLCRYALAAIEKQNRMLPLALDMRLEGMQDDAHIYFELYQNRADAWHLIDQWEPEMGQIGARIPEHLSFSLNGQLPGENYREYKTRLREDVAQLLAELFNQHLNHDEPGPAAREYMQPQPEAGAADDWQAAQPDDETDAR